MHLQTATSSSSTTTTTTTMAYPSLPASPTLTNPDMILPYGGYNSTPSPPQNPDRPPSPPGAWEKGDLTFSIGPPSSSSLQSMPMGMGIGPMTPTTPIIYGNGTMLSDIGEVTEVESTPRRPRNTRAKNPPLDRDGPVGSSPTMGYAALLKRSRTDSHHRTVSQESTSTVTTEGQAAEYFEDFDDVVSVDDSNFQGDDEESVVDDPEAYRFEPTQTAIPVRFVAGREGKVTLVGADANEDSASSAALSRRAEMILANAKKRLDNMEGNLTRARSSLYITPSSSMSSIHSSSPLSRSTPSPPDADRRIIAGLGVPPARHRQLNNISIPGQASPGHSRVLSENSIPTPGSPYSPLYPTSAPRAVLLDDEKPIHYSKPLSPLSGDSTTPEPFEAPRSSTADPYSQPHDHRVITRSASSMQMRDLTDKMKDLKGKISTLRDRAREDTMKRRSLQSLRTPSPFTAAEQWYAASKTSNNPWNGEPSVSGSAAGDGEAEEGGRKEKDGPPSVYEDVEEAKGVDQQHGNPVLPPLSEEERYDTAEEQEQPQKDDVEDYEQDYDYVSVEGEGEGEDEGEMDGEEADYESDASAAASLYHDTLSTPISHEDREDAFDYEHFFLHSAMGTLSRQRGRSGSFSSEDSVETARGLSPQPRPQLATRDSRTAAGHLRNQKSADSVSTLATFATARERTSDDLGSRDDSIEEEGDELAAAREGADDERPETPLTAKRSTFGTPTKLPLDREAQAENGIGDTAGDADGDESTPGSGPQDVVRGADGATGHGFHRPSVASFASTGTTRSFPLVNKPKAGSVVGARSTDALSLHLGGDGAAEARPGESPVQMLVRDDQMLVERLVASLGKCVLGLQEAGRGSTEGRMWRRRLDGARRVLEGLEGGG